MRTAKAEPGLSVEDLVDDVAKKGNVGRHEVARHLYWLWREEAKLRLEDHQPPSTLVQYFKSLYSLWFWALAVLVALTASTIYLLPQTPPYVYLRYVLGSFFILYLPGFTLIEALFPERAPIQTGTKELDNIERIALSAGMSLALVPLIGLGLNYTPWGIRLDPIFLSLSLLTVALAAAAVVRRFSCFKMEAKATLESLSSRKPGGSAFRQDLDGKKA